MTAETEAFLALMLPQLHDAEVSFRNGDAAPRLALWSTAEPTSWLGQYGACITGPDAVADHFGWVASRFTGSREFRLDVICAEVVGDAAYLVGYETSIVGFAGHEQTAMTHRVGRVFRREAGRWRIAHGHGDVAPYVVRSAGI